MVQYEQTLWCIKPKSGFEYKTFLNIILFFAGKLLFAKCARLQPKKLKNWGKKKNCLKMHVMYARKHNFMQVFSSMLMLFYYLAPTEWHYRDVIIHAVHFWGQERGLPVGQECPTCDWIKMSG